jgi:polyribonucleotide nucleotidyltransferase
MRQWLLGGVARRSSGSDLFLGVRRITGLESSVATPHGITLSTGELAHLADGAVYAQFGRTTALCTTVSSRSPVEHSKASFVPLTIEYREKQSAIGRIPPTFNRREGRQQDREVLSSRLIDRAVRPLFPSGYAFETQVVANVLSSDGETDPDILCINAASAALFVSDIPWHGPIGAVRVAMAHDGSLTTNPSASTADSSLLSLVYAGTISNCPSDCPSRPLMSPKGFFNL